MAFNHICGIGFYIITLIVAVLGIMNIFGRTFNKRIQNLSEEDRLPAARFNGIGLLICAVGCALLGTDLLRELFPFEVSVNFGYIGLLTFAVGWVIKGWWQKRLK